MSRVSRSVLRASCVAFCVAVALPVFATTYYVDAEKGDDGYDGTSPDTARKTWAGAIELLTANGDVLKFAKGTYAVDAEFTTKLSSLVIEGTGEKPEVVVFNGKGATRWLRLKAGGHTLRNLTAQNFLSPAATKLPASALFIEGGNASKIESCRFIGCTNLATCAEDRGSDWVKRAWGGAVCTFCPCTVTNSQFIGNFGKYGGGYSAAKSKTYVYDSTFSGNVATFRGGGLHAYDTTVVVGCTFTSNSVTGGNGGGICQGDSIPTVTDCTFRGNYASGGGGALCGGNITVSDCRFYGNIAKTSGGAFNKNGGVAGKIIRCTFVDNCTTNGQGGAVYAAGSPVIIGQIDQCVFTNNWATSEGGAIYALVLAMNKCEFVGNHNRSNGGAWRIHTNNGWPEIYKGVGDAYWSVSNCIFRKNWNFIPRGNTFYCGAAVALGAYNSDWTANIERYHFVNCEFSDNEFKVNGSMSGSQGNYEGGALYSPGNVFVEGCGFTNNLIIGHGGAFAGSSTGGIRRCSFVGNKAWCNSNLDKRDGAGGAIFFYSAVGGVHRNPDGSPLVNVVEGCEFVSNSVCGSGGSAISVMQQGLRLVDSTFVGNTTVATNGNGFVYTGAVAFDNYQTKNCKGYDYADNLMPFEIDRCKFVGNGGIVRGGAIALGVNGLNAKGLYQCEGSIRNCFFKDNFVTNRFYSGKSQRDSNAGAIYVGTQRVDIANCTFVGNTAEKQAGAIYLMKRADGLPSRASVTNCVFVDNADAAAALTDDDIYTADDSQIGYCYSALGGGRITDGVNDCIVKPGENPFRADDHTTYAVRKGCGSGVGLKLGWMTPESLDLGGKPRLAKNEDGEVVVDFGCYQFWRKPGLLLFVW